MSEADGLRSEIDVAINLTERVQAIALAYRTAIDELQGAIIMFDLHSDNMYVRSAARMSPLIGKGVPDDQEITAQVKTELQNWRNHV